MSQNNRPLASHPAFRYMVALWFAALLGFGTYVMPAGVFERAVEATGLASILPAAAPPLGETARLLISAAAAVLGALLGLFVASRAGSGEPSEADGEAEEIVLPDPEPAPVSVEGRRRPLLVREALAEDFADAPEPVEEQAIASGAHSVSDETVNFHEEAGPEEIDDPLGEHFLETGPEPDFTIDETFVEQPDTDYPSILHIGSVPEEDASEPAAPAQEDLGELAARLEDALFAYRERMAGTEEGDVVAFLRRTAENGGTASYSQPSRPVDPREELRGALAKLSRFSRDG